MKSEKHNGQLKRICAPAIELLRYLVTLESDSERGNFYYDRFVHLSFSDLKLINFPKHIQLGPGKFAYSGKKQQMESNDEDAFVLLTIILGDHRTPEGKINILDINDFLLFNDVCNEKYTYWLQNSSTADQVMIRYI